MNDELRDKLDAVWKDITYYNIIRIRVGNQVFRKEYTGEVLNIIDTLGALTCSYGHCAEIDKAKIKCYEIIKL